MRLPIGGLRAQNDLLTRTQALNGMTEAALRHRLRPGGPWRIVLPGVCLATAGLPTIGQREMAALLYCGPGSAITGMAALERLGIRAPYSEVTEVLVPVSTRRQSVGFVRVHRTIRMPERFWLASGIRYAPVARSVADAVRGWTDQRAIRAVVAEAVQRGRCPIQELAAELAAGPKRGSGGLRVALAEVADGVRSVAEADLRSLIKSARLPTPCTTLACSWRRRSSRSRMPGGLTPGWPARSTRASGTCPRMAGTAHFLATPG
jgi:hypothetical protein